MILYGALMAVLDNDILQYHSQNIIIILPLQVSVSLVFPDLVGPLSPAEPIMPVRFASSFILQATRSRSSPSTESRNDQLDCAALFLPLAPLRPLNRPNFYY